MRTQFFKHIYPWLIVTVLFTFSCKDYDQRKELDEVNIAKIEVDTNRYTLTQMQHIKIEPRISELIPGDSYTYEWSVFFNQSTAGTDVTVLSQEKDLDMDITLSPAAYRLQYTVTNTRTKLKTIKLMHLTVNGAFYQGWMVAHNRNDKAAFSFIRADDQVFLTPAEEVNQLVFPGRAAGVAYARVGSAPTRSILYFTTEAAYRFDQNGLKLVGTTKDLIPTKTSFSAPVYGLSLLAYDQYIVDQGKVFVGLGTNVLDSPADALQKVYSPFSESLPGDCELFPAVIASPYTSTLFYDNKHKRFMTVGYTSRQILPAISDPSATFPMGDVGKTMIASDRGRNVSLQANIWYFVMEDANGRYLYSVNAAKPVHNQKINYATSPDFNMATQFATSHVYEDMYYAAGNKVYMYDMAANAAQLAYEFPAGYTVVDLEIQRSPSGTLAVATSRGGEGEVYLFSINELGLFAGGTYNKKFTGFGEIVQIAHRQQ